MGQAKIAISIDDALLARVDALVAENFYPNRSRAIQEAVQEKLEMLDRGRLARECAKLAPFSEKMLSEEHMAIEAEQWPTY